MFKNSYNEYIEILKAIKATGKVRSFEEAEKENEFIVIRHDIEFSIERAYQMALIEAKYGILSSYFVQIGNNAYNALSDENVCKIKEINSMGHIIGLHYRQADNEIVELKKQINILRAGTGLPIKAFSTHRPRPDTKYDEYEIKETINAYGPKFFKKVSNIADITENDTQYISDSKFRWNYGDPKRLSHRKIQILIHPFQWFEDECSIEECFRRITAEKSTELKQTYRNEFVRYKEVESGSEGLEIQAQYNKY